MEAYTVTTRIPLSSQRKVTPQEQAKKLRMEIAAEGAYAFAEVYFPFLLVAQDDIYDKDPKEHDDAKVIIEAGTKMPPSIFHHDIYETFTIRGQKLREAWIAPRGFAKSTVITILVLWLAAFELRDFVLWTSETASQVEELVATIIDIIEGGGNLIDDFPHLLPKRDERNNYVKWTDRDIVLTSNFRLSARGAGKSTRGLRRGNVRPDLIICDDAEGEKTVGETGYPKTRRWLTRVLAPALSPGGDILWVNTLIEWQSVTGAMIRGDEDWVQKWNVRHLQAEWKETPEGDRVDVASLTYHEPSNKEIHGRPYDGDVDDLVHKLLWEAYWPQERIDAFKEENGILAYSFEMLNKPMSEGDKVFANPDWLKWCTFEGDMVYFEGRGRDNWTNANLLTHVTFVDPAFGGRDYAAVVTVAFFQHDFIVREAWWQRGAGIRTAQVDEAVRQAEYWDSKVIGIENVAAQIMVADETVRKSRIPVEPVHPKGKNKVDRALPVAIRASQGHVFFESGGKGLPPLMQILRDFPGTMIDDPVDAFVYAIEMAAAIRSKFIVAS